MKNDAASVFNGRWDNVFVICGATGIGKSELAVQVAEMFGDTEIVSVDAYQVYRGMEVLTAAPTAKQRARIPHHLIAEIDPGIAMSAVDFAKLSRHSLQGVLERGHRALVVGGNGLYLAALFGAVGEAPPSDPALRSQLEAKPLGELLDQLEELDPVAAQRIDRSNPRRVLRALEVCLLTGQQFSNFREDWQQKSNSAPALLHAAYPPGVMLETERDLLTERIRRRACTMLDLGAIEEVAALRGHIGTTASKAIGFQEICQLLDGKITREACIDSISQRTRQYAKRQATWFRNKTPFYKIAPSLDEILATFDAFGKTPH